jgi:anti-sigma B factor antagonist
LKAALRRRRDRRREKENPAVNLTLIPATPWLVVRVDCPRIDASVAAKFRAELQRVTETGHRRLVIDLSQVRFLDSSGLGALVRTLKLLGKQGEIRIAGASPAVESMLRITRMDLLFALYPSNATAIGTVPMAV